MEAPIEEWELSLEAPIKEWELSLEAPIVLPESLSERFTTSTEEELELLLDLSTVEHTISASDELSSASFTGIWKASRLSKSSMLEPTVSCCDREGQGAWREELDELLSFRVLMLMALSA